MKLLVIQCLIGDTILTLGQLHLLNAPIANDPWSNSVWAAILKANIPLGPRRLTVKIKLLSPDTTDLMHPKFLCFIA